MRNYKFAGLKSIILTAALMCLLPIFAAAQAPTFQLSSTEVFDPYDLFGYGSLGRTINPGTLTCPGAQPTGNPMQPCPPGSRIHLRGVSGVSMMSGEDPLLEGSFHWEMNANFDATGAGHAWGRFRLELENDDGVWEGSWTSKRSKVENMNVWSGCGRFVGRGTSGIVDGMQLRLTETASTYMLLPLAWVGIVDATILVPPSR